MSISAANLTAWNTVNVPQNDTSTVGGAIDSASPLVAWQGDPGGFSVRVSGGTGLDTGVNVTVKARSQNTGKIDTDTKAVGPSPISLNGLNAPERILSVSFSAATDGDPITIAKDATPFTVYISLNPITATSRRWSRVFPNAYSDAVVTTTRYDKTFWLNADALTALGPTYRLSADPAAIIQQGIHTSKNDTVTIANRLAVPGGITFVDDNIDQVGSDLATSDVQGVWWQQTATAGAGPVTTANSQFTSQITVASI